MEQQNGEMAAVNVNGGEEHQEVKNKPRPPPQKCPRCGSIETKFCYYNNNSFTQPRYFCKACKRYWTHGGSLRDIPAGGCSRRTRRPYKRSSSNADPVPADGETNMLLLEPSADETYFDYSGGVGFPSYGLEQQQFMYSQAFDVGGLDISSNHQMWPVQQTFYNGGNVMGPEEGSCSSCDNNDGISGSSFEPSYWIDRTFDPRAS